MISSLSLNNRVIKFHPHSGCLLSEWFQIKLLDFTAKGNDSLVRWAILPAGPGEYFTNATAMVSLHFRIVWFSVSITSTIGLVTMLIGRVLLHDYLNIVSGFLMTLGVINWLDGILSLRRSSKLLFKSCSLYIFSLCFYIWLPPPLSLSVWG